MAAYPGGVKAFSNRTDNVDTVYAANVNDLQGEVAAIERAVGLNPAAWGGVTYLYPPRTPQNYNAPPLPPVTAMTAPVTYSSVADRLNALQAQVAWLTTLSLGSDVTARPIVGHQPVSVIRATGASFTPGFANWQPFPWSATDYDPNSMFQGGTDIACPQSGWWRFSLQVWADVAQIPGIHHANVRLIINGVEAGTDGSQVQVGVVDQHRMNLAFEGPWSAGQLVSAQLSHAPGDGNNAPVNARSTISLTYLRDIA